ncbi:DUF2243 domain-containing protein [Lihuaxuella thermophila]|uniref:Uncharacterized membrane protein n=1 Tax=Lihuaxuella thermophila TaxID=1173111 RepID=A0A1H8E516_9BACL|nr:DUF2243 domain-containing protein [Lihuaxuella thermophila]SEN13867.1 Uncharacterized membrane protein [Lihuaxuella thermophila]
MRKLFLGAFLFGVGVIGMLDGIIFHQLLQWHSMVMYRTKPDQVVSDGVFHLAVTTVWFVATLLVLHSDPPTAPPQRRTFWGGFLLGGGLFNLIEGIVDHHLLGVHHVNEYAANPLGYDLLFDAVAVGMIGWGYFLTRKGKKVRT